MRVSPKSDYWIIFILISIPFINVILAFAEGFTGQYWLFLLLPIQTLPFLIGVALTVVCVLRFFQTILIKPLQPLRLLLFVLAPSLFIAGTFFLGSGADWFLQGFRFGMLQRISIAEISTIATVAGETIPDGSLILPPDAANGRGQPDNAERWQNFLARTPVKHLNQRFVVYNRDGYIQIEWGGALTGHYGLRVGHLVGRGERDYSFLPINENIAAYHTD